MVVVVPGIMGSALAIDGIPVWAHSGAALLRGLRTFGRSIWLQSDRYNSQRLQGNREPVHPGEVTALADTDGHSQELSRR